MIRMALREICEFVSWQPETVEELVRIKILNPNEARMILAFMKKQKC